MIKLKDLLKEAISGADRKILFILIREIVKNLKPKIKNFDANNKSHMDRVGSSILGIIRAMTYTPDNVNYKNFKKYFPKNFNSKLVQKKLQQFHNQTDKVQVTLVKQAMNNVLGEGKLTEKKFIPTVTIEKYDNVVMVKKFKTEKDADKFIRQFNKKNKLKRGKGLWYNPKTGVELFRNF